MAQQRQQQLERGGVFVVTDPPPSFDFGIDCMNYETRADFRGVCMIPAGLHFVYWGTGMGSRQGCFMFFDKDEIIVKSWDSVVEDLLPTHSLSEWSLSNLRTAIHRGELDANLGPYPFETLNSWQNLSNYISLSALALVGIGPHTPVFPGDLEELPANQKAERDLQSVQPYFPNAARVAQFCDIKDIERRFLQTHQFQDQSQLSQFHLERSDLLAHLLSAHYQSWETLLGELQISFLLFMLIYSHPALQHWKSLVYLISSSERILLQHPLFTCGFLRTFYEQLHYSPDDFFETELSCDNFLRPVLSSLFENLGGASTGEGLDDHVREHRNRLFTFTQKKFNIYREESRSTGVDKFALAEEDMPVVVTEQEIRSLEKYSPVSVPPPAAPPAGPESGISVAAEGLFSWRYPLLFDAMQRHNSEGLVAGEDMVMAAMRILDEVESSDASKTLRDEAINFLENEVSLWPQPASDGFSLAASS
jgi:A1 cistron-splicing factor AAR2